MDTFNQSYSNNLNQNFSSNSNYSQSHNDFQPSQFQPVAQTAPAADSSYTTSRSQHDFIPDADPEFKSPGHDKRIQHQQG
jgi:hypothetical protein